MESNRVAESELDTNNNRESKRAKSCAMYAVEGEILNSYAEKSEQKQATTCVSNGEEDKDENRMLWNPKNSKIQVSKTKLKQFQLIVETKYNINFGN